jgi:hypothetical protein
MEPTRDDLIDSFREGICLQVLFNANALTTAREVLSTVFTGTAALREVALMQCCYADRTCFRELLHLLVQQPYLTRLSIAAEDLSPLLADIATLPPAAAAIATTATPTVSLEKLELVASRHRITNAEAMHLKHILKIPSQTLSISFSLQQKDYEACLLALRQGMDELNHNGCSFLPNNSSNIHQTAIVPSVPRVCFRNVAFSDHEFHLHKFMAMLCEAKCVDDLQLNPRRRTFASDMDSMHVGPGFLPALVRLLVCGSIKSLEVGNVIIDKKVLTVTGSVSIETELKQALASNTTLESLALPATKGMASLWERAIFPAMTVNTTLQRLEFGYETVRTVPTFLQYLPLMKGLQSIRAPWRTSDGSSWVQAMQQNQSLLHADLVETPDLNVHPLSKQEDSCLVTTRQLLERNRLCQTARTIIATDPSPTVVINGLGEMTAGDVGIDARYMILRDSLTLFAH